MALAPPPPPPPAAPPRPTGAPAAPPYVAIAPASRPTTGDTAARIGLVLALVVALAGAVGAVAKSGDDAPVAAIGGVPAGDADPAEEAPFVVPDGFQVVQGDGAYLAVPASWVVVTPSMRGELFDEAAFDAIYPELDRGVRDSMLRTLDRGAMLMAIDPSPEGAGDNINVVKMSGEAPLRLLATQVERELEGAGLGAQVHGTSEVETPLGDVLRVAYSIEVLGEPVEAVQYYVPVGGETYIVTGTGAVDLTDQAIQTLRLGDAPAAS